MLRPYIYSCSEHHERGPVSATRTSINEWLHRFPADLLILGGLALPLYLAATLHGDFRPRRMEPFFPIFAGLFLLYAVACWRILRGKVTAEYALPLIFTFAVLFNLLLIPSPPKLSDDMYRYIWDGRVQASGINPYRYPSDAPELAHLRDNDIWRVMNRHDAVTIYPPGSQIVFAATWHIFGDSVAGMKLVMIGATILAGWLLVLLLRALDQPPERALIFLWSPLLVFEVAHGGHVDALYLPLIVGAFLLRARAPANRVSWRYEAGIGVLIGLAALVKLYPAFIAACLWSIRDEKGRRRWRLSMPAATVATIALGYLLYIAPGVDALGFLPTYGREFFNISPHMRVLTRLAIDNGVHWSIPANYGMPALVLAFSLWCWAFPARTPRIAILRCYWPIGIYLLLNHNLFSWYALWLLPLIAISLQASLNTALAWWSLAWWAFTGTIALSYTFFIRWQIETWGIRLQFWPIYLLFAGSLLLYVRARLRTNPDIHLKRTEVPLEST